jgi:hypothetical protein
VLGKVGGMQTKATIESVGSPVPGVIPEPVRVQEDATAPDHRRTATATRAPAPRLGSARRVRDRLLAILHGDKYMVATDPPTWPPAPTTTRGSTAKAVSEDPTAAGAADTRTGEAS